MFSVRSDSRPAISPNDVGTLSRLNRAAERAGEFGDKPKREPTPVEIARKKRLKEIRERGSKDYEAFRWGRPMDLEGEDLDEWWMGRNEAERRYSERKLHPVSSGK